MHRKRYGFPPQVGGERKEPKLPDAKLGGSQGGDLSPPDAKTYLKDLSVELRKPVRHKIPTRSVYAAAKDTTWALDLADMSHWKEENDGATFILTCVDVFTRWAAARALRSKNATSVLNALKDIVRESKRQPKKLWTDEGREFLNSEMKQWRDEHGIIIYHTYGPHKASIVEAFNKTLKTMMWKKLTAMNSHRWLSILQGLIAEYNARPHRTIKMSPDEASMKPEAVGKVWKDKLELEQKKKPKVALKVGDVVRVSRVKGTWEKGYDQNWTRAEYTISRIDATSNPVMYYLTAYSGEPVAGSWYTEELQKVKHPGTYLVEKILQRKGDQVLVRWLGWGEEYDSWEPAAGMVDV